MLDTPSQIYFYSVSDFTALYRNSGSSGGEADDNNNTLVVREPTQDELEHWLKHSTFTDDLREVPWNMTAAAQVASSGDHVLAASDPSNLQWLDMIGPYQQNLPGLALRPFYPTTDGYTAMARTLLSRIRDTPNADAHLVIAPPTLQEKPKNSLQIILFSYEDLRWWRLYQGPQGVAVSPRSPAHSRFKVLEKDTEDCKLQA